MIKPWDSRIAHALIRPLRDTRVHPNHVTILGLLTGLVAALLYARGGTSAHLGGIVLIVAMVLDHADGELARLTGKTSELGHRLDRIADFVVKLGAFLGMGIGLRGSLGAWGPILGACVGGALLTIFNARSALARRRGAEAFRQPAFAGFEIEDILYLIGPVTWVGVLPAFFVAAGIGAPLFALWTLVQLRRAVEADRAARLTPAISVSRGDLSAGVGPTLAWRADRKGSLTGSSEHASTLPFSLRPGLAAGIAIFTGLIAWHGLTEIGHALALAGWGLLVVAAFHGLPLVADALGWRSLVGHQETPPARTFVRARWIGESVNGLLPVMQIGGNVAKARLLARHGVPRTVAGASVVVDVSLVMLSQVLFSLVGVGLLLGKLGGVRLVAPVLLGLGLMSLLLLGFLFAQRAGVFGVGARALQRFGTRSSWASLGGGIGPDAADAMDAEIAQLHRKRSRVLRATAWHLSSWVVGTGEVWLALYFLGHPVGFSGALLLESLGQAVRAAAFAIPGALGVQEGGLILLGAVVGLGPDVCLALSLSKRAREVLLGVPGLIVWQADAARRSLERTEGSVEMLRDTGS